MDYAKKAISCNDIKALTPDLFEQILTKKLGENFQTTNLRKKYLGLSFEELIIKGFYNSLKFAIHLNTADETLFLEIDRNSFPKDNKLLTEENKKAFNALKTVIEEKIFRYEHLLSFNADYPYYSLENNDVQTNYSKTFATLWVNISDPRLTYSNYLSLNLGAKFNPFIEAWLLQNNEVKLDNLIYNPKYAKTVGKIEVLEELCKEPDKRETYLRGFKKCGIEKAKVYSNHYGPELEL